MEASRRSSADFAQQIGIGVVQKADAGRLEAESSGKPVAQIESIEVRKFVAHEAHASLKVEGSGHSKHHPDDSFEADTGFHSQVMEEIKERAGGEYGCVRRAGDGTETEVRGAAHCGGDVAAADIERKHTALCRVCHHEHRKPQPMRARSHRP